MENVRKERPDPSGPRSPAAETVLLFVPGITALSGPARAGQMQRAAREQGWDFVRFDDPARGHAPDRMSYPRMVKAAAQLALGLPHRRVVLAGADVGAGMAPYIADRVNAVKPGHVSALFGWMVVTPRALRQHFIMQPEYRPFIEGAQAAFNVALATGRRQVTVTREQFNGICAMPEPGRFDGRVLFIAGRRDPVGRPVYTQDLVKSLGAPASACVELDCGPSLPRQEIRPRLAQLHAQMG